METQLQTCLAKYCIENRGYDVLESVSIGVLAELTANIIEDIGRRAISEWQRDLSVSSVSSSSSNVSFSQILLALTSFSSNSFRPSPSLSIPHLAAFIRKLDTCHSDSSLSSLFSSSSLSLSSSLSTPSLSTSNSSSSNSSSPSSSSLGNGIMLSGEKELPTLSQVLRQDEPIFSSQKGASNVPEWLPQYPESRTYSSTPFYPVPYSDPLDLSASRQQQQLAITSSLARLSEKLDSAELSLSAIDFSQALADDISSSNVSNPHADQTAPPPPPFPVAEDVAHPLAPEQVAQLFDNPFLKNAPPPRSPLPPPSTLRLPPTLISDEQALPFLKYSSSSLPSLLDINSTIPAFVLSRPISGIERERKIQRINAILNLKLS